MVVKTSRTYDDLTLKLVDPVLLPGLKSRTGYETTSFSWVYAFHECEKRSSKTVAGKLPK